MSSRVTTGRCVYDVGTASAGGMVAVVIANILAFFLVRIVGRNLEA